MYLGVVLSSTSREAILEMFPASHPEIIAHHVTLQFPFKQEDFTADLEDHHVSFKVVGYNKNDQVDCIVVEPHEYDAHLINSLKTPDKILHVTLSVNRENKGSPVMSNQLLKNSGFHPMEFKLNISGTIKLLS